VHIVLCWLQVQPVVRTRSSALTRAGVFQHDGSVMETTIVGTCLMNRTVEVLPPVSIFVFW